MKPQSEKKLQEWIENAKRLGLDPNDIQLFISVDPEPEKPAEPPESPCFA